MILLVWTILTIIIERATMLIGVTYMGEAEAALSQLEDVSEELRQRGDDGLARRITEIGATLRRQPAEPARALLSTGDAATMLGVRSVNTIKRWAREGLLEGYQVGGRVKVSKGSVEQMLKTPALSKQREYEREVTAALEPFDAGDEPVETDMAHMGRTPWDRVATTAG